MPAAIERIYWRMRSGFVTALPDTTQCIYGPAGRRISRQILDLQRVSPTDRSQKARRTSKTFPTAANGLLSMSQWSEFARLSQDCICQLVKGDESPRFLLGGLIHSRELAGR